jgi:hypothetical protein
VPASPALLLERERLPRLTVPDHPVDLYAVQRAFDAQHDGWHNDNVAITHRKVARGDVVMHDE